MKPVLAIGDVHGHLDRLEELLEQEGIINADGDRINNDVEVIQLGDLGHFGGTRGSPTGDHMCYEFALGRNWVDIVLWGNHDRAVVSKIHEFSGFEKPSDTTIKLMLELQNQDRLIFCAARHGYFLSHAGLHAQWKHQPLPDSVDRNDPEQAAAYINGGNDTAVVDAVSMRRGGRAPFGGLLWRDASERLFNGFPQVFGHTAKPKIRKYLADDRVSYCIDIGGKDQHRLAGIWLPDERLVRIGEEIIIEGPSEAVAALERMIDKGHPDAQELQKIKGLIDGSDLHDDGPSS